MDFATRYFLSQSGLDPRKDVKLVQIGRVPDILGALMSGSIDAGTMAFPYNFSAGKLGFRELADLSDMKVKYASTAFLAKRKFLSENKSRMKDFVKALIEAVRYLKTHREEALKLLSRYTRINDLEILAAAYDIHVSKIWPRVPQVQPEDLKLVLEELAEANPKARDIDPSELIYSAVVKDVLATGFVERLYAR